MVDTLALSPAWHWALFTVIAIYAPVSPLARDRRKGLFIATRGQMHLRAVLLPIVLGIFGTYLSAEVPYYFPAFPPGRSGLESSVFLQHNEAYPHRHTRRTLE